MATDREGIVKAGEAGVAEPDAVARHAQHMGRRSAGEVDAIYAELPDYPYDVAKQRNPRGGGGSTGRRSSSPPAPCRWPPTSWLRPAAAAKAIGLVPEIKTISPTSTRALFSAAAARKGIDLFLTAWYTSLATRSRCTGCSGPASSATTATGPTRPSTRTPRRRSAR